MRIPESGPAPDSVIGGAYSSAPLSYAGGLENTWLKTGIMVATVDRAREPCYDPWVVLAYVACATTTIRLATNVYILPLRHPLQTAPDEIIRILRRLWSEEAIEDHSDYYDFGPLHFEPKPLQKPSIPIEVGGTSRAALQRAGTLGDGWIEVGARDAGATRVIAMPWRGGSAVSPAEAREWADRYADEVING